uniref:Ig-like domain-containing protein n=1 Tax=Salmo trutta TaxID=8032 RepID=A0A673WHE3_SALTR
MCNALAIERNLLELQPEVFSVVSTGAYRVSVKTGGSTTIPCRYDLKYKTNVKYLCKEDYLKRCSPDVHTKSIDKASVYDDTNKQTFTVTMSDLEPEDYGRYWCAVEIIGGSNVIIEKFQLFVTTGKILATIPYDYMTGVLVTFTGFTIELTYGMLVYVYFCSLYIISSLYLWSVVTKKHLITQDLLWCLYLCVQVLQNSMWTNGR